MKTYMVKTILFGFLTALVFGSLANATADNQGPDIETVTPWPDNVGHGEQVYVDAKIADHHTVESAWLEVHANGKRVSSGSLVDSNNDGYYVSPVAFTAEGGKTYDITVKAKDRQGNQASEKVSVKTDCVLGFEQTCFY